MTAFSGFAAAVALMLIARWANRNLPTLTLSGPCEGGLCDTRDTR
jgi:hypothetical protein